LHGNVAYPVTLDPRRFGRIVTLRGRPEVGEDAAFHGGGGAAKVEAVEQAPFLSGRGGDPAILTGKRETQAVEDPARFLRHRPDDFRDALAKGDAAPFGKLAGRIGAGIVARHVLCALAGQGADKLAVVLEVVAAIVERHAVAVARHA